MLPVFPGWHSIRAEVVTPDVFANQLPEASELVQRVCRYIQQHVAEPLSLTTLAARAAVSQPHLSRQFREQLGITVMGYVTCCRISLAQYYLSSPASQDLTVREIGELVGFVDSSYFSRVFKSLEGISPHQFRHKRGGASAPPD
jgi:two-component system response regulator YesN